MPPKEARRAARRSHSRAANDPIPPGPPRDSSDEYARGQHKVPSLSSRGAIIPQERTVIPPTEPRSYTGAHTASNLRRPTSDSQGHTQTYTFLPISPPSHSQRPRNTYPTHDRPNVLNPVLATLTTRAKHSPCQTPTQPRRYNTSTHKHQHPDTTQLSSHSPIPLLPTPQCLPSRNAGPPQ